MAGRHLHLRAAAARIDVSGYPDGDMPAVALTLSPPVSPAAFGVSLHLSRKEAVALAECLTAAAAAAGGAHE